MGDWTLTIRGNGPHHNNVETDAEQLAADFVEDLAEQYPHEVLSAEFTGGGETTDLLSLIANRDPLRNAVGQAGEQPGQAPAAPPADAPPAVQPVGEPTAGDGA